MTSTTASAPQTSTQRILERAIEVIDEAGEAAIRTNPIAAECGVTPPILYRAFKSREGLVIAAQAERYKRSTEAAAFMLIDLIHSATSPDDLKGKISQALDYIFSDIRRGPREIRTSVIGSAVSRPELRAEIVKIDTWYMTQIADAYEEAIAKGWVDTAIKLQAIVLWAQGLTNSRAMVEFADDKSIADAWNVLSKKAILSAIFGEA
jgi:AcrR family transcriptional regulator